MRFAAFPRPLARVSFARLTRRSTVKSVSLIAATSLVIHQRSASLPKLRARSVGASWDPDDLEILAPSMLRYGWTWMRVGSGSLADRRKAGQ